MKSYKSRKKYNKNRKIRSKKRYNRNSMRRYRKKQRGGSGKNKYTGWLCIKYDKTSLDPLDCTSPKYTFKINQDTTTLTYHQDNNNNNIKSLSNITEIKKHNIVNNGVSINILIISNKNTTLRIAMNDNIDSFLNEIKLLFKII